MDEKAPRPQVTKELLILRSAQRLDDQRRQLLAADLLSVPGRLPRKWLTRQQFDFVELDVNVVVEPEIMAAAADLAQRVLPFCDLVSALLDDAASRRSAIADLPRDVGIPLICEIIFRRYRRRWPPGDPQRISSRARSEIDEALWAESVSRRPSPAADRDDRPPPEHWNITRATDDSRRLRRYIVWYLLQAFVNTAPGLAIMTVSAAVYLALFEAVGYLSPELTTREQMIFAGVGATTTLGGSALKARLDRGRGPAGPGVGNPGSG